MAIIYYKILLESGDYILLETGDKVLLEHFWNKETEQTATWTKEKRLQVCH